jgi:hypothetical protein
MTKVFASKKDYKIFAPQVGGTKNPHRRGLNKEIFMLIIETTRKVLFMM